MGIIPYARFGAGLWQRRQNRGRKKSSLLRTSGVLTHCIAVRIDCAGDDASLNIGGVKGHRLIRTIARWMLVALLFTQGTLVANACLRLDTSPQAPFGMSQKEDCDMGTTNPNACLFGYLDLSDHSAAQPTVPPATRYVVVPLVVARLAGVPDARAALPPPGCAPPIPIRYCSLLI